MLEPNKMEKYKINVRRERRRRMGRMCVCVHVRKRESGINLLTRWMCLTNSS